MSLPHLEAFARDPLYFITACIAERRELLTNATSFQTLKEIWQRSSEANGWFVGRFL
jgi:hypothetical protein